jgi:hypothetical protein
MTYLLLKYFIKKKKKVPNKSGQGMKLTTHLHLVQRLRIHGAKPPLPNTSLWHGI